MQPRMVLEGLPELRRLFKQMGAEVPKELGQGFKRVGAFIISRLPSQSVGAGAGATVRPSAAARELQLRAGGSHRSKNVQQWGKQQVRPHPERPFILGTAQAHQDEIEDMLLDEIDGLIRRHGLQG